MFRGKEIYFILALIVLYVLSVITHLGYQQLGAEEPRRAIISIEMMHSGVFIRPTQMGEEYLNKPVLFNWILCGMMWLTGSSAEWVLRFPSLICFLLIALFHYRLLKNYFKPSSALLSSFFVLTSLEIFFYGLMKGAEIDIFYSLIVYLQVISLFYYYERKKWGSLFVWSYFLCAIGLLTKGLPSLVFQGFTLLALCVYAKSLRVIFKWQHLAGFAVFVFVTALYFYGYSFYGSPVKLALNLINESLLHSSVGEDSGKAMVKSLGYPFLLFKLTAPWVLLLLLLVKKKYRGIIYHPLVRFSVLFIVFNLWVYFFTGLPKARYVYMFVPFGCIIFTALYDQLTDQNPALLKKVLNYFLWIFSTIAAGIILLPFFVKVSWLYVTILTLVFSAFLALYIRFTDQRIWLLILGLILTRLVYATLVLPIQSDADLNYRAIARDIAAANQSRPVYFYSPQDSTKAVNTSVFGLNWAKAQPHSYLFAQVPYYYYQKTGTVVYYDSLLRPGNTYLSLLSEARSMTSHTLYTYYDEHQKDSFVVFKVP